jgi:hypothetical protein
MNWQPAIYALIALLLFEGCTNFRVPRIVSLLRYGKDAHSGPETTSRNCRFNFDAERALRFAVAALIIIPSYVFPQQTWFIPWFVAIMLATAGFTNICPLYMGIRSLGFK